MNPSCQDDNNGASPSKKNQGSGTIWFGDVDDLLAEKQDHDKDFWSSSLHSTSSSSSCCSASSISLENVCISAADNDDTFVNEYHGNNPNIGKLERLQHRRRSKVLVIGILLSVITIMQLVAYRREHAMEKSMMTPRSGDDPIPPPGMLLEQLAMHLQNILTVSISNPLMALAVHLEQQYALPFVTVPNFQQQIDTTMNSSFVALVPFVSATQRAQWEHYARRNQFWIREGRSNVLPFAAVPAKIFHAVDDADGSVAVPYPSDAVVPSQSDSSYYAPLWQIAPAPLYPTMVNYDLLSHPQLAKAIRSMTEQRAAVISSIVKMPTIRAGSSNSSFPHFGPPPVPTENDDAVENPHLAILHPILDSNQTVAGFLMAYVSLPSLLESAMDRMLINHPGLPTGSTLRLSNSCDETTVEEFRVDEENRFVFAEESGNGRQSEPKRLATALFNFPMELGVAKSSPSDLETSAVPENSCAYVLDLYSDIVDELSQHEFSKAISMFSMMTHVILLSGLSVILFCFIFECWVDRRQGDNQESQQARRLQSALDGMLPQWFQRSWFRKAFYDAMHQTETNSTTTPSMPDEEMIIFTSPSVGRPVERKYFHFSLPILARDPAQDHTNDDAESCSTARITNRPAHNIPPPSAFGVQHCPREESKSSCTILHGRLAGFDQWSKSRSHTQVAAILETIQTSFHSISVSMGRIYFRMDASDNSFIATGSLASDLKNEDHAVRLCRFAQACMSQLAEIMAESELLDIVDQIASSFLTESVSLKVGLHTGESASGTSLCIDQSCDTFNQAKHLEQSALPDVIHVSQTTANELTRHGFEHWITKSSDDAMTFWVDVNMPRRTSLLGTLSTEASSLGSNPLPPPPPTSSPLMIPRHSMRKRVMV